MKYETLFIEIKGSVAFVQLNRPDVKNAMNERMIAELKDFFLRPELGSKYRAIVLKGKGGFFCAGGDLQWMKSSQSKTPKDNEEDARELGRMIRALDECPIPVITAVKGGAFGGGVGLVAASDIVIAEESAVFSLSEVKLGLIPATIGPIVMRKIGISEARRLYLTGKRFSAAEAKRIHLIHDVVPEGSLTAVVLDYLKELESSAPKAVQRGKRLVREILGEALWKEDIAEETSKVLSQIRIGDEAQAGMKAFLEKQAPPWKRSLTEPD